jgi:ribulose-phosphate 3-epimerase
MKIAPSILTADFLNLQKSLDSISNADLLHLDIMDYHFVPNLSFGPAIVKQIIDYIDIPSDIHLMIDNPECWAMDFINAGADSISFHYGTVADPVELARMIKATGTKVTLSIKPKESLDQVLDIVQEFDMILIMSVEPGFGGQGFIPSSLEKIVALKQYIVANKLDTLIEVDGGVKLENIKQIADAGADIIVAGSAVFDADSPNDAIEELRRKTK